MNTGYGFKKTLSVFAVASLAWLPFAVRADVSAAWNQNADGNWSDTGKWAGGNAATGATGVATFTMSITAGRTVTVDSSPWTINGMTFANSGSYGWTVTGGTLNLAGTAPTLTVNSGGAKVASVLTGSAGLTKAGAGTLTLSGANTYSGITATLSGAGGLQIGDGSSATASAGSGLLAVGLNTTLFLNMNAAATLGNSSVTSAPSMIQNIGIGKVTITNGLIVGTVDGGSAGIVLANPVSADFTPRGDLTFASTSVGRTAVSGAPGTTMHIVNSGLFWWTGANSVANAPTFDVAAGVTVSLNSGQQAGTIYYNNLTGAGSFTFDGGNASQFGIVLGTNTLGGTLTANRPFSFGNGGTGGLAGSGTLVASANGAILFNSTTDNTYSGNMSGAGALVKTNANTLTLTGANTYSGATTVSGGTLAIGGSGKLGGGSYAGSMVNNGTFIYGSSAAQTLSGAILGTGSLTKTNTSTLTLSGYNTYSGATRVNAGKLVGATGGSCLNSRVTVADGATNGVSMLAYGDQWTCASLAYAGGSASLDIDFASPPVSALLAPLKINGDLSVTGTVDVAVRNGYWPSTGTYPLVSYTGSLSGPGSFNLVSLPPGLSATLINNTGAKRLELSVTAVPAAVGSSSTWTKLVGGIASGDWGTAANWSAAVPNSADVIADFSTLDITSASYVNNDAPHTVGRLRFGDTAASHDWYVTNSTLALATSVGVPFVTMNNRTATIASGLTGTQGFMKDGGGILSLSGGTTNTFGGPVVVGEGTLSVLNGASLKNTTSPITVLSGASCSLFANWDGNAVTNALCLSGAGLGTWGALHVGQNVVLTSPITLTTDCRITHRDNCSLNGPITATGIGKNLELHLSEYRYAATVNGKISLGTGTLTLNSIADGRNPQGFTLQLNAANTYAGGTILTNYAIVKIANVGALGSGGLTLYPNTGIDLYTCSITLPWLSAPGGGATITDTGAAGTTVLTVNQSADTAFSGVISNGALRAVALLKTGAGTLALSGTNTYTGATTVSNGTLCVSGSFGNTAVTVGTGCVFAAGATGVVGRATIAGTLTFQNNSRLLVDVLPPAADTISVAGNVTIGSNVELRVSGDQTRRGGSWKVVESTGGTLSGDFLFVGLAKGVTLTKVDNAVWLTIPPKGTLFGVR